MYQFGALSELAQLKRIIEWGGMEIREQSLKLLSDFCDFSKN